MKGQREEGAHKSHENRSKHPQSPGLYVLQQGQMYLIKGWESYSAFLAFFLTVVH